jgi:hypothetical protein
MLSADGAVSRWRKGIQYANTVSETTRRRNLEEGKEPFLWLED